MYSNNPWWGNSQPNNGGQPQNQPPANMGQRLSRYAPNTQTQVPVLPGRMVQSPNDIMPDEVPMNGSLSVFPLEDTSAIYAKCWTDNGIISVRYIPEKQVMEQRPQVAAIPEDFKQAVFARLDAIEAAVSKKPSTRTTKEEKTNG